MGWEERAALQELLESKGYRRDQPREPKGSPRGGQFAKKGGESAVASLFSSKSDSKSGGSVGWEQARRDIRDRKMGLGGAGWKESRKEWHREVDRIAELPPTKRLAAAERYIKGKPYEHSIIFDDKMNVVAASHGGSFSTSAVGKSGARKAIQTHNHPSFLSQQRGDHTLSDADISSSLWRARTSLDSRKARDPIFGDMVNQPTRKPTTIRAVDSSGRVSHMTSRGGSSKKASASRSKAMRAAASAAQARAIKKHGPLAMVSQEKRHDLRRAARAFDGDPESSLHVRFKSGFIPPHLRESFRPYGLELLEKGARGDQPREPKGSPRGGQFAKKVGAAKASISANKKKIAAAGAGAAMVGLALNARAAKRNPSMALGAIAKQVAMDETLGRVSDKIGRSMMKGSMASDPAVKALARKDPGFLNKKGGGLARRAVGRAKMMREVNRISKLPRNQRLMAAEKYIKNQPVEIGIMFDENMRPLAASYGHGSINSLAPRVRDVARADKIIVTHNHPSAVRGAERLSGSDYVGLAGLGNAKRTMAMQGDTAMGKLLKPKAGSAMTIRSVAPSGRVGHAKISRGRDITVGSSTKSKKITSGTYKKGLVRSGKRAMGKDARSVRGQHQKGLADSTLLGGIRTKTGFRPAGLKESFDPFSLELLEKGGTRSYNRHPKGSPRGGQFAPKGGGGRGGAAHSATGSRHSRVVTDTRAKRAGGGYATGSVHEWNGTVVGVSTGRQEPYRDKVAGKAGLAGAAVGAVTGAALFGKMGFMDGRSKAGKVGLAAFHGGAGALGGALVGGGLAAGAGDAIAGITKRGRRERAQADASRARMEKRVVSQANKISGKNWNRRGWNQVSGAADEVHAVANSDKEIRRFLGEVSRKGSTPHSISAMASRVNYGMPGSREKSPGYQSAYEKGRKAGLSEQREARESFAPFSLELLEKGARGDQPREPKGSPRGGQFARKVGSGAKDIATMSHQIGRAGAVQGGARGVAMGAVMGASFSRGRSVKSVAADTLKGAAMGGASGASIGYTSGAVGGATMGTAFKATGAVIKKNNKSVGKKRRRAAAAAKRGDEKTAKKLRKRAARQKALGNAVGVAGMVGGIAGGIYVGVKAGSKAPGALSSAMGKASRAAAKQKGLGGFTRGGHRYNAATKTVTLRKSAYRKAVIPKARRLTESSGKIGLRQLA